MKKGNNINPRVTSVFLFSHEICGTRVVVTNLTKCLLLVPHPLAALAVARPRLWLHDQEEEVQSDRGKLLLPVQVEASLAVLGQLVCGGFIPRILLELKLDPYQCWWSACSSSPQYSCFTFGENTREHSYL